MEILRFIVFDILGVTPLLVGFIAMAGLIIQRKAIEKVLSGTFKTIVGFLVFAGGAGLAVTSLGNFQTLFSEGFGLKGVMPLAEALTGLAQTKFAMNVSLIMVLGFAWNLLFARLTPFKYIFLTGQHNLYLSALLTVTLKALGYGDIVTIIVGSVLLGLAACIYPAIAQPWMRKITGNDEIAMGHYVTLAYAISGWIGSKVGDPRQSTEKLNLPGWLGIFKDYIVSVSISVTVFYYIAALAAGKTAVHAAAGGMHWLVYPLYQSLTFTASLYIIITGVRLLLSEIVPAFLGISEKFIPNSKPALDCPVVFPYAPTATVLGFISSFIGGLVVMGVLAVIGQTVIIPVAIPYFFIGATAAVFGNASGGWKGAVAGSFITGILIGIGPALIYPIMESVGLSGTSFPETDFVALGLIVYYIGKMLP